MPVPSEVFAEDIEALLERLDGVAAARVVATDAGEIDRIYVTATGEHDAAKIRQTVAAALMSRYSLAIDGWRIRVARLRSEPLAHPRWFMQRVEEGLTGSDVRVMVELRSEDGSGPPLVGRARGMTDAASRLRIPALATLDALGSMFEAEDRRVTVESIVPVPLATGKAMVVALSVASASAADRYVGAALVEGSEAEAVIAATLDAVGKRAMPGRRGWTMRDRREELESMEAHYRRQRGPQRQMPQPAPPPDDEAPQEEPRDPVPARAPQAPRPAARDDVNDDRWQDDGVATLEQIRPERQGGAEVAQPMNRPQDMDRGRFAPKSSMEDDFFRHLVTTGTPVHIRCRDGYEILGGIVRNFGTYSLLVETDGRRELVFKHGIIAIGPLSPKTGAD